MVEGIEAQSTPGAWLQEPAGCHLQSKKVNRVHHHHQSARPIGFQFQPGSQGPDGVPAILLFEKYSWHFGRGKTLFGQPVVGYGPHIGPKAGALSPAIWCLKRYDMQARVIFLPGFQADFAFVATQSQRGSGRKARFGVAGQCSGR